MPHRVVTDSLGRSWDVWDTRPGPRSKVSPAFQEGWLTFESATEPPVKRRLVPIPANWEKLPDPELIVFLGEAKEVVASKITTLSALEDSSAPPLR